MYLFTLIKGDGPITNFFSSIPPYLIPGIIILDRLEFHRESIFYLYILIEPINLFKLTLLPHASFDIITIKDLSLPLDLKRIDFARLSQVNSTITFDIETNVNTELIIIQRILTQLKSKNLITIAISLVPRKLTLNLNPSNFSSGLLLIELMEGLKLHPLLNSFRVTPVIK